MIEQLWAAFTEAAAQVNDDEFECELNMCRDGSGEMLVRRVVMRPTPAPYPNGWKNQDLQAKWDNIPDGIMALNELSQKALSPT